MALVLHREKKCWTRSREFVGPRIVEDSKTLTRRQRDDVFVSFETFSLQQQQQPTTTTVSNGGKRCKRKKTRHPETENPERSLCVRLCLCVCSGIPKISFTPSTHFARAFPLCLSVCLSVCVYIGSPSHGRTGTRHTHTHLHTGLSQY